MDSSIPQQLDDLKVLANQILAATTDYRGKRAWFQGKLQYVDPSDLYAALLDRIVTGGVQWVDVGGGQTVLPWNERFAAQLAGRTGRLVAIDPSPNVQMNPLVHERHQCRLEDYRGPGGFDLATLRMVAEHVVQPAELTRKLAELIRPAGLVAVLTPHRWSPASIAARLIPNALHPCFTRWLDGRVAEETFPTFYRMNTRTRLRQVCEEGGFTEERVWLLDDCSVLQQFGSVFLMQMGLSRVCRGLGIAYPENVLLGLYRRRTSP